MTEEEMKRRIAMANDVYDWLMGLNQEFLVAMGRRKWRWLLSFKVFTVMSLLWKITAFEHEAIEIAYALQGNPDFRETHELLTDFNDLLDHFKPTFIEYVTLGKIRSHETPEDLFNIFTYGGKV